MGQPFEVALTVCRLKSGQLVRGTEAKGRTPYSVQLRIGCPPGAVTTAIYHTHPGGKAEPSAVDILEARRLGIKHLCVENDFEMRCYET